MQNINDLLKNQGQNQNEEDEQNAQDVYETQDAQNFPQQSPQSDSQKYSIPQNEDSEETVGEEEAAGAAEGETAEEAVSEKDEGSEISASKFLVIKEIIENIKSELLRIGELLGASVSERDLEEVSKRLTTTKTSREKVEESQMRVVEGVFDGQNMIGGDGEHYTVPANYASKSKLVEGDLLKLTILQDGSFVYKQIAPIERRRIVGALVYDEAGDQYYVLAEGKRWKVLRASITYFKGELGDEVTIVIPKESPSQWAAVENIIKK